jgi:hypothetical protein
VSMKYPGQPFRRRIPTRFMLRCHSPGIV